MAVGVVARDLAAEPDHGARAEPRGEAALHLRLRALGLAENLRRLRGARDANGKPLDVIELPMPEPLVWRGERCPASYANFYLANGAALVPVFGAREDARALATLRELWPARDVVPVPARHLVVGLGAVHCLTQQEPQAEAPTPA